MSDERTRATTLEAARQIIRFWRILLTQTGARQMLAASGLMLLAGLIETFTLYLLVPLVRLLDPGAGTGAGSMAWLLQRLGVQPNLLSVLAMFVSVAIARSLVNRLANIRLEALRLKLIRDMRVGLYSAIAHADWSFLRHIRRSQFLTALTAETDRLDSAIYFALQLPERAMMVGAHVVAAYIIAPALTVGALGMGFLISWLLRGRLSESLRLGETLSAAHDKFYHHISEFLAGLKITKSYVSEDRHVTAFAHAIDDVTSNVLSYNSSRANTRAVQEIAGVFAVAIFLWASADLLHMPAPELLVAALIFQRLLPQVQSLQQSAQQLLHSASAAYVVLDLLKACSAAREPRHAQPEHAIRLEKNINLERLCFRHDENGPLVLKDVTIEFPMGSLTALCGPSGAGKSTLLDLVAGLLRPDSGKISIDGRELTDETRRVWRNSVAYVLQEPFLFHDTIRANLLVAKPSASDRDLHEALALSGAAKFVDALPRRLDTLVGDRGARFSGGERQRLALARALLRNPELLILDEPTSSLDERNEAWVLEGIEALRGRVTMILATHRPDRLQSPSQVLHIEGGKLQRLTLDLGPR